MPPAPKNNPNHPVKGAAIKVYPVRHLHQIETIKSNISNNPRNLCLFTLGINTAYRANELLSITLGQVWHLKKGDVLDLKQSKTDAYRQITLNGNAVDSIQNWIAHYPLERASDAPLFLSARTGQTLCVPAVSRLIKGFCKQANIEGNYGSHTLRKTWGYQQRLQAKAPLYLLMRAFGHSTELQTLEYLCIQPEEIQSLYLGLEL